MTPDERMKVLEVERASFNTALQKGMDAAADKFVLWKDGASHGVFDTYDEAYSAGLKEFGLEVVFLVAQADEDGPAFARRAREEQTSVERETPSNPRDETRN